MNHGRAMKSLLTDTICIQIFIIFFLQKAEMFVCLFM